MTPNEITPSRSNPTEAATATATAERGAPSTKVTGSAQATVNPKKRKRYATVFDAVAGIASLAFLFFLFISFFPLMFSPMTVVD